MNGLLKNDIEARLDYIKLSQADKERVFSLLSIPDHLWGEDDRQFMMAVLHRVKQKQYTQQGIGCWVMIIIAVVVVVWVVSNTRH